MQNESANWVVVGTFNQPVQAHLARTQLETEGITCVVRDEFTVRVNWLFANAIGGVKLMVPQWDASRARDVLRPRPRLVVVAGAAELPSDPDDLICPRCRSFDVYFHRFNRRVAGVAWLVFGFAVPWLSRKWVCTQCGYEWKERIAAKEGPDAGE